MRTKGVFYFFIAAIVLYFSAILFNKIRIGFSELDEEFTYDLPSTYELTAEDSSLIGSKYIDNLRVIEIIRNKECPPISCLDFGGKYSLFIHRIGIDNVENLGDAVKLDRRYTDRSVGEIYRILGNGHFYLYQYLINNPDSISQIAVSVNADSLKTICKNDSMVSFSLICKRLSISYRKDNLVKDIFLIGRDRGLGNSELIPLNILFLRKNGFIYFLMMSPKNKNERIPSDLLANVFQNI